VGLSLNAGNPKSKVRVRIRDKEHGGMGLRPWGMLILVSSKKSI
jgi:hypothetical protein